MIRMNASRNTIGALLLAVATAAPAIGLSGAAGDAVAQLEIGTGGPTGLDMNIAADGLLQQPIAAGATLDMSAAEAARNARREYGGKVLSVSRVGSGEHAHYTVKLLSDGNVRIVRMPPEQEGNTNARAAD